MHHHYLRTSRIDRIGKRCTLGSLCMCLSITLRLFFLYWLCAHTAAFMLLVESEKRVKNASSAMEIRSEKLDTEVHLIHSFVFVHKIRSTCVPFGSPYGFNINSLYSSTAATSFMLHSILLIYEAHTTTCTMCAQVPSIHNCVCILCGFLYVCLCG